MQMPGDLHSRQVRRCAPWLDWLGACALASAWCSSVRLVCAAQQKHLKSQQALCWQKTTSTRLAVLRSPKAACQACLGCNDARFSVRAGDVMCVSRVQHERTLHRTSTQRQLPRTSMPERQSPSACRLKHCYADIHSLAPNSAGCGVETGWPLACLSKGPPTWQDRCVTPMVFRDFSGKYAHRRKAPARRAY